MSPTPRGYDRFMVYTKIGTDSRIKRLPVSQRWCFVAGVMAVAAESPVRGWLLIVERMAATVDDIADAASVSRRVARDTVNALVGLDVLVWDDDVNCWALPDWHQWNPDPKRDQKAAERQKRYRDRLRERRNALRDVTPITRDGKEAA